MSNRRLHMSGSSSPSKDALLCGGLLGAVGLFALVCVLVGQKDESAAITAFLVLAIGWVLAALCAWFRRAQLRSALAVSTPPPSWRQWAGGGLASGIAFSIPMLVVACSASVRNLDESHKEAISAASATLGIAALIAVLGVGLGKRRTQTAPKRCSACGHGIASFQTRCPECGGERIVMCDE